MIRLAARAREAGIAPVVEAGFLNYSRPTFAETLERCVARGVGEVVVQPYFLIPGKFVQEDIPPLVEHGRECYPAVRFALAQPFGDHAALAHLVCKRVAETAAMSPGSLAETGVLIMAHGSPDPAANQPIYGVAGRVRRHGHYAAVEVCFLGLNEPGIPAAIDGLVAQGITRLVAVPYFLQLGGHVAEDLPEVIEVARVHHPTAQISLAEHLAYDRLLLAVIADRVAEAIGEVHLSQRSCHVVCDHRHPSLRAAQLPVSVREWVA